MLCISIFPFWLDGREGGFIEERTGIKAKLVEFINGK
jgi:hypothetical protein